MMADRNLETQPAADALARAKAAFNRGEAQNAYQIVADEVTIEVIQNHVNDAIELLTLAAQDEIHIDVLRLLLRRGVPTHQKADGAPHSALDVAILSENTLGMQLLMAVPGAIYANETISHLIRFCKPTEPLQAFLNKHPNFRCDHIEDCLEERGTDDTCYLLEKFLYDYIQFDRFGVNRQWVLERRKTFAQDKMLHVLLASPVRREGPPLLCNHRLLNKLYRLPSADLEIIYHHLSRTLEPNTLQYVLCEKINEVLYPSLGARVLSGVLLALAAIPLSIRYFDRRVFPDANSADAFTNRFMQTRLPGVSRLCWRQVSERYAAPAVQPARFYAEEPQGASDDRHMPSEADLPPSYVRGRNMLRRSDRIKNGEIVEISPSPVRNAHSFRRA